MLQTPLNTRRLLLRPFRRGDAAAVQRLAGDPEVASTTLNIPHPYSLAMARQWLKTHPGQRRVGTAAVYAVCARNGELLGCVGLSIERRHNHAALGYWIGRDHWGRGYCTEAAAALIGFAFDILKLRRVYAHHLSRNPASGRVMEKLGMNYEGRFPQHVLKNGVYEDIIQYGLVNAAADSVEDSVEDSVGDSVGD